MAWRCASSMPRELANPRLSSPPNTLTSGTWPETLRRTAVRLQNRVSGAERGPAREGATDRPASTGRPALKAGVSGRNVGPGLRSVAFRGSSVGAASPAAAARIATLTGVLAFGLALTFQGGCNLGATPLGRNSPHDRRLVGQFLTLGVQALAAIRSRPSAKSSTTRSPTK